MIAAVLDSEGNMRECPEHLSPIDRAESDGGFLTPIGDATRASASRKSTIVGDHNRKVSISTEIVQQP